MTHPSIINCPRVFLDPGNDYPITTTLQSAISNTQDNDFTITVADTTNFKQSGYITINQETFYYSSKTSTTLLNVYRALKNTTRRDHIIGSTVQQLNESVNKLVTDNELAGWYVDGYSNQASLRVQDAPVIQPGVIRYVVDENTPSNSKFQGCTRVLSSGPVWQDFNATQGDKGDPGDINATLDFVHVSNSQSDNDLNSGAIIKTENLSTAESSRVNVRRIVSGTRNINGTTTTTVDIETNNNSIIINPKSQPYVDSLLNPITTLKGSSNNKVYGTTQRIYVKPGKKIEKGQVTRYVVHLFTDNNYYLCVEPYTYTSSDELSKYKSTLDTGSREIAGVSTETYDATSQLTTLTPITICTKGICQIKIGNKDSFSKSTDVNIQYIGKPCIMNYSGFGLCLSSNEKPEINYMELGGFLESYTGEDKDISYEGAFILINFNPQYVENA